MHETRISVFHSGALAAAFYRGLKGLNPFLLWRNPVIFITEIGAILTTVDALFISSIVDPFVAHLSIWLWITVIFANTAEALAEIPSEERTETLRHARSEILTSHYDQDGNLNVVSNKELKKGDLILVRKGETIPADGEIISGSASIDESSLTGEAHVVTRKALSNTANVIAGTTVVSSEVVIKVTANPGEGFFDKMIEQIEGSRRKKTSNELGFTILLSSLSVIFLTMILSFQLFARYYNVELNLTMQIALLTCIIPTTIASLLNAVGIAGVNHLLKRNVVAMSGQAVEVAGEIDVLLLDKTGTITAGMREAVAIEPSFAVPEEECARACYLASLSDATKEGKSIASYVLEHCPIVCVPPRIKYESIPFREEFRISGIDMGEEQFRKGSVDAIEEFLGKKISHDLSIVIDRIAQKRDTPLLVADKDRVLGVITLRDSIKTDASTMFKEFKMLGIKTVIVTGDNPVTAAAVAKEVHADEFLALSTPEQKQHYIRQEQMDGRVVAMTGDKITDAPALASADLAVAMYNGSQVAKDAANMIDLDSQPAKIFEIIQTGKQLLMTRGALTAFSLATDLAKYFIVLPALLIPAIRGYEMFNFLHLSSPKNAVLSTVIFNALSLIALIPLGFKGVKVFRQRTGTILAKQMLLYGIGGLILPFIGIKLIDMLLYHLSLTTW